jgi:hypothetical protein
VLCCGEPPALVDGKPTDRLQKLSQQPSWKKCDPAEAVKLAAEQSNAHGLRIERAENDGGILFHHRRTLDDGDLLLLVNTSSESPSRGVLKSSARGVEQWNLFTGRFAPFASQKAGAEIQAAFDIPPCGSLLLFFRKGEGPQPQVEAKAAAGAATASAALAPVGPMEIRRLGPNVLTIDYFDAAAAGESLSGVIFYKACQFGFQKNGMDRNPWDSAVQFKDELIARKFPPESGVEATYRFTIEGSVPRPLWIVVERPDLYALTCNGKPLKAEPGQWWLDKCFGKLDLAAAAQVGENAVTIKAAPFTIFHELQPAYVLGEFALRPAEKGFAITPSKPLTLGRWNEQGLPFYAQGAAYRQRFAVGQPTGRYRVVVPAWYGSVAKVLVNDKPAGHLVSRPWECDVTEAIRPGENVIEIVVVGTLKNTLGPHHGNPPLGTAWPASFRRGPETGPPPGEKYHVVPYGLFEPFVLEQIKPQ